MNFYVKIAIIALLTLVLLRILHLYAKDIAFYRRNNWNFDLDSGQVIFSGSESDTDRGNPMSNRTRFYFGFPACIFFALLFLVLVVVMG